MLLRVRRMSRAIPLPESSHIPFRGDSLNSRGSGASSIYPPPPRHSMHYCTKEGQRRVSQYLAMATASRAKEIGRGSWRERVWQYVSIPCADVSVNKQNKCI